MSYDASSSRANFLGLLRAGHGDYVLNDQAFAYMRRRHLAGPVITTLAGHPARHFADQSARDAHLAALGITGMKVHPDPVMVATEGALWGAVTAHGFLVSPPVSQRGLAKRVGIPLSTLRTWMDEKDWTDALEREKEMRRERLHLPSRPFAPLRKFRNLRKVRGDI